MTSHATPQRKSSHTTAPAKRRAVGSYQDARAKLLHKQLGSFVKLMREHRGVGISTLSLVTGISPGTIVRWEKHGQAMTMPHLVLVSRYFFMPPWVFMQKAVEQWKDNDYAP